MDIQLCSTEIETVTNYSWPLLNKMFSFTNYELLGGYINKFPSSPMHYVAVLQCGLCEC